jgi:hypothetical protein
MATYAGFAAPETHMQAPTVSEHAPSAVSDGIPKGCDLCKQSPTNASADHTVRNRVQRVEASLHLGRPVSDADLLQHARDCSDLMHVCYGLFEAGKGAEYRAEAQRWQYQAQHARACLSPEWKAKREAQIQSAIGSAHFMDDGDRAREQIAANEGKA